LEWRYCSDLEALLTETEPILPDLDLCHITLNEGQYVLWVSIDEMAIKGYSPIHRSLGTSKGLMDLGLAVMEKLSMLLLHAAASSGLHDYSASCVIEFKTNPVQNYRKGPKPFQRKICEALEKLVTCIRYHYPNILGKAYIINPLEEYLAYLDIDETLLGNTVLLKNPEDLGRYLGSQLPPRYGGVGKSFAETDLLHRHCFVRNQEGNADLDTSEISAAAGTDIEEKTEVKKEDIAFAMDIGCYEDIETKEKTEAKEETTASAMDIGCPEGLETEEKTEAKDEMTASAMAGGCHEGSETEGKAEMEEEPTASAIDIGCPEGLETEQPKPRLIYSEKIGLPSIILDPADLQTADDLCPDKMGARVVFADSDMVVKFGHGVGLGEAEALHLASTRTTIAVPKLLSAYILDGVGYIIMSYEAGESLAQYWDRVSDAEHNRILEQLRDYVNQMREIPGDFIGGLDRSPCRDGIFEAGYRDYTKYSYGPYPSEESFNEGIVQALRDRLPPKSLEREHDMESEFFNTDYMLHQTVRGLKNHKIVFTHGDLHAGNILVRTDGTVVLLDWGLAGFWPEYWEFYRAMHNPPWRASWDRMVEKFIPPFYVEYSVIKRVFATAWY
jgi:hypothetical protein